MKSVLPGIVHATCPMCGEEIVFVKRFDSNTLDA